MNKLDELLGLDSLEPFDSKKKIQLLGSLIDQSLDNNSLEGIELAIRLSIQIEEKKLTLVQTCLLHYFLANAWSVKRTYKFKGGTDQWNFRIMEISQELFHLRKAISSKGFEKLNAYRKCQIYTNLGNVFNFIGRFVEAQESWSRAITLKPNFAMALLNRGRGLFDYSRYVADRYHHSIFKVSCYFSLREALKNKTEFHPSQISDIEAFFQTIEKIIPPIFRNHAPPLNEYFLGKNKMLVSYRKWSLKHALYINPINDLGAFNIACHDSMQLPTLTLEADSPPHYITLFNEIKQSFGSARFLCYEYLTNKTKHYSDKDIILSETNETILFSFSLEKAKLSFRLAYSLFDKIAFMLNDYFKLGIPLEQVKFGSVWYENKKKKTFRAPFNGSKNLALRGLYWLYKDLHEIDNVKTIVEPDAEKLANLRNHIEHRTIKIVENIDISKTIYNIEKDISFPMSKSEFDIKLLRIQKLSRAAIMYLSMAIYYEESKKQNPKVITKNVLLKSIKR